VRILESAARHATDPDYDKTIIINTLDFKFNLVIWASMVV
jgi:hypothetical protein